MAWTKGKKAAVAVAVVFGVVAVAVLLAFPRNRNKLVRVVTGKPMGLNNTFNRVVEDADHKAENARLRSQVWPKEKQLMQEKIKARQAVDETAGATTIDLKHYTNAALTDAPVCWAGNNANNLAELPQGKNIYGGVPFDVEGAIYLTGGWLKDHYHKDYPVRVDDIRIDRRCSRIHLLHGGALIAFNQLNQAIAKLVLHYEDGSSEELPIIVGKHLWDSWAPLFSTGVNPLNLKTPPGAEPAWVGSNAHLRKYQPDESFVLYKASFDNPKPNLTVTSLDYVSTETQTVPFMVGLTVE